MYLRDAIFQIHQKSRRLAICLSLMPLSAQREIIALSSSLPVPHQPVDKHSYRSEVSEFGVSVASEVGEELVCAFRCQLVAIYQRLEALLIECYSMG